jgi:hypothetical protein
MRVNRTSEATPFAPSARLPESERRPSTQGSTPSETRAASPVTGSQPFASLLRGLGQELDRGEDLAQKAIHGGAHAGTSPEKLIALQAGIYRYSEAVDLASKLVDRGTQAVRTTLQNQ